MTDSSVPPGTYAGQSRSPVAWVFLCPPCGGYAPLTEEDYSGALTGRCGGCGSPCRELHRFPSVIDSAAGCGCRGEHPRVTGDLAAADSAAELVRWLHGQAAAMRERSREGLSPEERAVLDEPPGIGRKWPVVVLDGQRAHQAQLASALTMAIAHIAVMRPEIPHAPAGPVLDDSGRFQVEEARAVLDGWGCKYPDPLAAPSLERLLADHGRALLDLLDKLAPKEAD